mmetsp:Transcript_28267/g.52120  ORF Transcript_28267/g.52120 Transcript_28267/m.52120 type:complete len:328 (-) Transcript_28267:377-1360(-)
MRLTSFFASISRFATSALGATSSVTTEVELALRSKPATSDAATGAVSSARSRAAHSLAVCGRGRAPRAAQESCNSCKGRCRSISKRFHNARRSAFSTHLLKSMRCSANKPLSSFTLRSLAEVPTEAVEGVLSDVEGAARALAGVGDAEGQGSGCGSGIEDSRCVEAGCGAGAGLARFKKSPKALCGDAECPVHPSETDFTALPAGTSAWVLRKYTDSTALPAGTSAWVLRECCSGTCLSFGAVCGGARVLRQGVCTCATSSTFCACSKLVGWCLASLAGGMLPLLEWPSCPRTGDGHLRFRWPPARFAARLAPLSTVGSTGLCLTGS